MTERVVAGLLLVALGLLAGCAGGPRGRDGADTHPPPGLAQVPDAEPRIEAIRESGGTTKPYTVLGRSYVPITDDRPLRESGLASWYGRKFQGQSTASGELYDMYAMTAAHKTLPLPSYVRVRNPANGREVIVRVNDRGPFHDDRIIDLSYTAALKLDLLRGVAPVEIERITNEDVRIGAWRRGKGDASALALAAPGSRVDAAPSSAPSSATAPAPAPGAGAGSGAESGSVAIASALTSPVVAIPQTEVRELAALPPLSLPAPAATASPATESSTQAPPPGQTAPHPTPSDPSTSASPPAGFWVQLGAFSQRTGADNFHREVARRLPALAPTLAVFGERGTFRLQTGPYASRDRARETADRVRDGLQMEPLIVERR